MRLFGTGLGSDALPITQAELLRSAQELERALEAMPIAANARNIARRRAATQFKLGRIRVELGQSREAESLFAQAASGFWELGSPSDRDLAAWARIRQAATAAEARRTEEALAILDKMIEQFGGFPTLDNVLSGPADALSMWLRLLEQTNDPRRLYEAAGVTLAMLDPQEHAAFCTALACRAGSADELGYSEEAVTVYEQAIAWAEEEQPDYRSTRSSITPCGESRHSSTTSGVTRKPPLPTGGSSNASEPKGRGGHARLSWTRGTGSLQFGGGVRLASDECSLTVGKALTRMLAAIASIDVHQPSGARL